MEFQWSSGTEVNRRGIAGSRPASLDSERIKEMGDDGIIVVRPGGRSDHSIHIASDVGDARPHADRASVALKVEDEARCRAKLHRRFTDDGKALLNEIRLHRCNSFGVGNICLAGWRRAEREKQGNVFVGDVVGKRCPLCADAIESIRLLRGLWGRGKLRGGKAVTGQVPLPDRRCGLVGEETQNAK
jgi:hypothetical protein